MKLHRILAVAVAACALWATAALAGDCCAKSSSAANAKSSCAAHGTAATAASAKGSNCAAAGNCPMSAAQCGAMGSACTAEMRARCARGTSASAASAKSKMAKGGCPMGGGSCEGAASASMTCAVCSDAAVCANDVHATGAHAQVVSLRNGTMLVYTADDAEHVRALQAAVARHNETVMNALAGGSDASLCGECKSLRGALASGKFSRELVNTKNGCQVLLTSTDAAMVRRIHGMTCNTAQRVGSAPSPAPARTSTKS